jgi:succinate dehydrogenase/fumarate reductase flavoprotein subunit
LLPLDDVQCDVLILGAGGAGMLAALHVTTANPRARIVIAVKGLIGCSACTFPATSVGPRRIKASNPACSK